MSTFGDLRSMIADRAWDQVLEIDLARLADAPLGLAQEHVKPHIMAALWGVPVKDGGWGRISAWRAGKPVASAEERICVDLKTVAVSLWAYGEGAREEMCRICDEIVALIDGIDGTPTLHIAAPLIYVCNRNLKGEAAQAEAVLMRSAALISRGWPVTLADAQAAIEPRPPWGTQERDAYDMRWGVDRTGEGTQGQRVDLLAIDDPIREDSTLGGGDDDD